MMKGIGDKQGMDRAKARIRVSQSNMRNFIDETERTRRRAREQLAINNPR